MSRSGATGDRSVLSLQFDVVEEGPDWPVTTIKVDGRDPSVDVANQWRGFDPAAMLGPCSPLLPDDQGRRVAVCRCSCGVAGCGVIAPFIVRSPDGRRISWVDVRDYVGVFDGPVADRSDRYDGQPWPLPDLHFDRVQYEAEVRRASADMSWETPRRKTSRLVEVRLTDLALTLPPNLTLRWVAPAGDADGVMLSFEHRALTTVEQQCLRLTSRCGDPESAAEDMVDQLLSTAPEDRVRTFGWQR